MTMAYHSHQKSTSFANSPSYELSCLLSYLILCTFSSLEIVQAYWDHYRRMSRAIQSFLWKLSYI